MSFNVQCDLSNKNNNIHNLIFSDSYKKRLKGDSCCRQKIAKTRLQKSKRGSYSNYGESQGNSRLKKALSLV